MNISYVSDVSEHSGLVDRSDLLSVSSITSSITKEPEENTLNLQLKIATTEGSLVSELDGSLLERKDQESETGSNGFQEKNTDEKTKADEQSGESSNEGDHETQVDNSMALVLVETPQKNEEKIDPEVLDVTVKQVLDALRHAKEQLQSSMERKRHKK